MDPRFAFFPCAAFLCSALISSLEPLKLGDEMYSTLYLSHIVNETPDTIRVSLLRNIAHTPDMTIADCLREPHATRELAVAHPGTMECNMRIPVVDCSDSKSKWTLHEQLLKIENISTRQLPLILFLRQEVARFSQEYPDGIFFSLENENADVIASATHNVTDLRLKKTLVTICIYRAHLQKADVGIKTE